MQTDGKSWTFRSGDLKSSKKQLPEFTWNYFNIISYPKYYDLYCSKVFTRNVWRLWTRPVIFTEIQVPHFQVYTELSLHLSSPSYNQSQLISKMPQFVHLCLLSYNNAYHNSKSDMCITYNCNKLTMLNKHMCCQLAVVYNLFDFNKWKKNQLT